jgi:hypothetical protein
MEHDCSGGGHISPAPWSGVGEYLSISIFALLPQANPHDKYTTTFTFTKEF